MPDRLQELQMAVDHGDLEEIHRLAHSIQGAAASVGGKRMHEASLRMELRAREKHLDGYGDMCAAVQQEFQELKRILDEFDWDCDAEQLMNKVGATT